MCRCPTNWESTNAANTRMGERSIRAGPMAIGTPMASSTRAIWLLRFKMEATHAMRCLTSIWSPERIYEVDFCDTSYGFRLIAPVARRSVRWDKSLTLGDEVPGSSAAYGSALAPTAQSQYAHQLGGLLQLPETLPVAQSRSDHGLDCDGQRNAVRC